jgi:hypothetical protein
LFEIEASPQGKRTIDKGGPEMVLEVLDKVHELEAASEELNATVSQQVAEIFEEAEQPSKVEDTKTKQWSYSVPFAGVRYYWY